MNSDWNPVAGRSKGAPVSVALSLAFLSGVPAASKTFLSQVSPQSVRSSALSCALYDPLHELGPNAAGLSPLICAVKSNCHMKQT